MKQLSLLEQARTLDPRRSDVEHIERIAATTISELEERAPVDLRVVASYRGINHIDVVPMPMSGCLAPEDGGIRMLLNSRDSIRRRRFTGFHEVGHSFQPGYRTRRQYRCNSSIKPRSDIDPEALSDAAAAALLLPEAEFAPEVRESVCGLSSVIDLADRYQASVQATAYRFQRYWPEPTLVVVLEQRAPQRRARRPQCCTQAPCRFDAANWLMALRPSEQVSKRERGPRASRAWRGC